MFGSVRMLGSADQGMPSRVAPAGLCGGFCCSGEARCIALKPSYPVQEERMGGLGVWGTGRGNVAFEWKRTQSTDSAHLRRDQTPSGRGKEPDR